MIAQIQPSSPMGEIRIPSSKSITQRACAAALIRKGKSILIHPGHSADEEAALHIIQQLGALITRKEDRIEIESRGILPKTDQLDCGESGLAFRLFTCLAATAASSFTITGSGSLLKRPAHFFDEVLPLLGVEVQSSNGYPPLHIQGPLVPSNIRMDGSLSSQYLTGLLFAFAASDATDCKIEIENLNSHFYVDLTLQVLQEFGLKTPIRIANNSFYFPPHSTTTFENPVLHYKIESDWSNAAFLLVGGAIAGDLVIKGLDVFSAQGDKAILQALMQAGAILSIEAEKIHIRKSKLKAFHVNATHTPDLFPPLVALAAYAEGTSVIEGVHRLFHKESNRALTLVEEFGKLGLNITLQDDMMVIRNGKLKGGTVHSCNDHRIAMALAIAALGAEGTVYIEQAEAVHKSYPQFFQNLANIGVSLSLT